MKELTAENVEFVAEALQLEKKDGAIQLTTTTTLKFSSKETEELFINLIQQLKSDSDGAHTKIDVEPELLEVLQSFRSTQFDN